MKRFKQHLEEGITGALAGAGLGHMVAPGAGTIIGGIAGHLAQRKIQKKKAAEKAKEEEVSADMAAFANKAKKEKMAAEEDKNKKPTRAKQGGNKLSDSGRRSYNRTEDGKRAFKSSVGD